MWSAAFFLTGQDGKLLFTCLIHVLDRNTNRVCLCVSLCVWLECESGLRDVLSVPMRAAYGSSHWSKEQSASVSPVGSSTFPLCIRMMALVRSCALFNPPFCSMLRWFFSQGQRNVPVLCLQLPHDHNHFVVVLCVNNSILFYFFIPKRFYDDTYTIIQMDEIQ